MSAVTIEATAVERVFVRTDGDGAHAPAARAVSTTPFAPVGTSAPSGQTGTSTGAGRGTAAGPARRTARPTGREAAPVGRAAAPAGREAGPRARLVRAAEPAAPVRATGPRHVVPPTVAHRLDVLRAQDRSPVLDAADEDRGAVPAHDPGVLAGRIALATVEVLGGRRPIGQLARWLTPGVLDALQVRAALTLRVRGSSGRAPQVRRVRTSAVDEHTLEAGVVVEDGAVVRAVALRLETHRGAWRATVVEIG